MGDRKLRLCAFYHLCQNGYSGVSVSWCSQFGSTGGGGGRGGGRARRRVSGCCNVCHLCEKVGKGRLVFENIQLRGAEAEGRIFFLLFFPFSCEKC